MTKAIKTRLWDVIVIGTGIGGGTLGRRLAESGLSVLFVEQGPNGPRGEQTALNDAVFDPVARQVRGFWPDPIKARINGRTSEFFAALGSGVGGSSVFYAATLERPERHDLETTVDRPHPTGGWPVNYDSFRPYYKQAEQAYHICGEPDPLSGEPPATLGTPPAQSAGDAALMQGFRNSGLHPYQAHMAARFLPDCKQCFGFKCPRKCKMDGRSAGVEPALVTGNATVLDRCKVTALQADRSGITHLDVIRNGQAFSLRAKRYVLAAGALASPRLLLASASADWPDGLANDSGQVGRNLMFHVNELFALWPKQGFKGASKAIALRDFYFHAGQRFGVVQALGLDASYGEIVHYLNMMFDRSFLSGLKPLRNLTRIPAAIAARLFGNAKVFVGILEDLPYPENRVLLEPDKPEQISIQYRFSDELLSRHRGFRRAIKRGFRGQKLAFLGQQPELNFGHPSGTLRFGNDPATSVLDANCRAHGLNNLYVADASFMPTSMGINPSLTIAANALRVADHIITEETSHG
jgi:choline dehydrogenase-like flavoprotein